MQPKWCILMMMLAGTILVGGAERAYGQTAAPPGTGGVQTVISAQARPARVDLSTELEARAAINRALDWLAARQNEDGSWSDTNFPALTGLPLWAFALSDHKDKARIMDKAVKFILSCVQPDGGIYRQVPGKGGGLPNYNTAICMVALHLVNDPKLTPVVLKARKFVAAGQHFGGDVYEGGMGYDRTTGRPYTDLSSSVLAYEAMRLTQSAEDLRDTSEKRVDLDWQAAQRFLARLQSTNAADTNNVGGFIYRPDESKAGIETNVEGRVVFRTYGSMTYAGLLSLIYADVSRDDPRVRSAFDWAARHWTLDENPGMGNEGLYYFYNVLTKALSAFGREEIPVRGGTPIMWRKALVEKLVKLQKLDGTTGHGYWANDNNRFWEGNNILVTAYSVIALQVALGK